ncbi:MAG: phospholipase D-like domain-containing protein [Luteolibacter sp.]
MLNFSTLELWLGGIVVLLLFVIWRLTQHQECGFLGEPEEGIENILPAIAGLCHSTVSEGNAVELIKGPDFFNRVIADIEKASHSVHLETFLWQDGKASDRVIAALCSAAARGVCVRIIADARGSSGLSSASREKLKGAGCHLHLFHPWRPMNLGRFNIRTHRKIVIIDGLIAYVGGHCITDAWLEETDGKPAFRDLTARLEGAVVNQVQSTFGENWTESECAPFADKQCFPVHEKVGGAKAHVASLRPDGCPSAVQVLYHLAIGTAGKSIYIQNPYFLPDPAGAEALAKAARRGVDVRIMTPSVESTDSFFVTYAGHFHFERLLEAGVRIFEYQPTLLHQKTITVDGTWCGIGSANFDDRSFEINDEIVVGIAEPSIVADLERVFEQDSRDCVEITLEKWRERSLFAKLRERLFYLFNEQF